MKKKILLFLAMIMSVSLMACGQNGTSEAGNDYSELIEILRVTGSILLRK